MTPTPRPPTMADGQTTQPSSSMTPTLPPPTTADGQTTQPPSSMTPTLPPPTMADGQRSSSRISDSRSARHRSRSQSQDLGGRNPRSYSRDQGRTSRRRYSSLGRSLRDRSIVSPTLQGLHSRGSSILPERPYQRHGSPAVLVTGNLDDVEHESESGSDSTPVLQSIRPKPGSGPALHKNGPKPSPNRDQSTAWNPRNLIGKSIQFAKPRKPYEGKSHSLAMVNTRQSGPMHSSNVLDERVSEVNHQKQLYDTVQMGVER